MVYREGLRCGYVELTPEQKDYYAKRKTTRMRLDLRGQKLHSIGLGSIVEIEEGLQKWWQEWQDVPDEIVVDSVEDFYKKLGASTALSSSVGTYRSKWNIDGKQYIPVFQNV